MATQAINRAERAAKARQRKYRKNYTKRRPKCRCDAYKLPHRPGGGLCRYPDPPVVRWQDAQAAEIAARVAEFKRRWGEPTTEQMADLIALTTKPCRPYRKRYAGVRLGLMLLQLALPGRHELVSDSELSAGRQQVIERLLADLLAVSHRDTAQLHGRFYV